MPTEELGASTRSETKASGEEKEGKKRGTRAEARKGGRHSHNLFEERKERGGHSLFGAPTLGELEPWRVAVFFLQDGHDEAWGWQDASMGSIGSRSSAQFVKKNIVLY